jgi:hypothetical protein
MSRIDAAAQWLMSDDSAYAAEPDAARRAAKQMLEAADLADEESIGPRLASARDALIAALGTEATLPSDSALADCADRIMADLYVNGYVVRRDALS